MRPSVTVHGARWVLALVLAFSVLSGPPVTALAIPLRPPDTVIEISRVTRGYRTISVAGSLTQGMDVLGQSRVIEDPAGDDADHVVMNGTDITGGSIRAVVRGSQSAIVFTIDVADEMPRFFVQPGYIYQWQFRVGAKEVYIAAGWPGPTFSLCRPDPPGGFNCQKSLSGSMSNGQIVVWVAYETMGLKAGDIVRAGSLWPSDGPVTSGIGVPHARGGGSGGGDDTGWMAPYHLPGAVFLGAVRRGSDCATAVARTKARISGSSFTGSVPKPLVVGTYVIVAKTYFGTRATCVTSSQTFKVRRKDLLFFV